MAKLTLNTIDKDKINNNAGTIVMSNTTYTIGFVKRASIELNDKFSSLFGINNSVLESIIRDMRANGYDRSQPLIIWKEKGILIDGHTRFKATEIVEIDDIPAIYLSFKDDGEVLDYMYKLQFSRRNITDSELISLIPKALEYYVKSYGEGSKADYLRERFITLSESKAKQIVVVLERASDEDITRIKNGELSIYQIYMSCKNSYLDTDKACVDVDDKDEVKEDVKATEDNRDDYDIISIYAKQFIRYDDQGAFYMFIPNEGKEIKIFTLHDEFNNDVIKDKFKEFIERKVINHIDNDV